MNLRQPDVNDLRAQAPGLPHFSAEKIVEYYQQLGELNVSPDDGCYPLGSCTMKFNPQVNDRAAGLPGFTQAHPQAPIEAVQGCLKSCIPSKNGLSR